MEDAFWEKHTPYESKNDREIDFAEKRFQFWLENVPADIRRLEYELWKLYKIDLHRRIHKGEKTKYVGRFKVIEFTEEDDEKYWEEFKNSFLFGEERKERFGEIIDETKKDLHTLIETYHDEIKIENVKLIALTGSAFYGPRCLIKKEYLTSKLSDIDVNFLMNTDNQDLNFEILPSDKEKIGKYHLRGTGWDDQARGERDLIHWLLYPHYPIFNNLKSTELKDLTEKLIKNTYSRKEEIENKIETFKKTLEEGKKIIIG